MYTREQYLTYTAISKVAVVMISVMAAFIPVRVAQSQIGPTSSSTVEQPNAYYSHMSEELRASIKKVIVIAGESPPREEITGDYEQQTLGMLGGMDAGTDAVTISKEIGGVPITIGHPILTIPAAIIGGIRGASQRRAQELRDVLTKDLADAADQPLTNDGLATDVYFGLKSVPGLNTSLYARSLPVPEDTDAVLYVSVNDVTIDVDKDEAILSTSAVATLRRLSDGRDLYEREVHYQDRDTLENWSKDEYALWRVYANFARHYLGRELSAEAFDRIQLRHELRPKESDTVSRVKKNDWQSVSKSTTPTLAWELKLLGGDTYGAWADAIDLSAIYYDVEIYDLRQLVYAESRIQGDSHTLLFEIESCKSYRWSVRPSYRVGSDVKFGEWMRLDPDNDAEKETGRGSVGRKASEAPAYIQDFATLNIECSKK